MGRDAFNKLHKVHELDELLSHSAERPVILFKHSNTCGVSARAYREMAKVEESISIITVQEARSLSNEIERRFELTHETPQVLIVRSGKIEWSASHFEITADAVNRAVEEAGV